MINYGYLLFRGGIAMRNENIYKYFQYYKNFLSKLKNDCPVPEVSIIYHIPFFFSYEEVDENLNKFSL